MQSKEIRRTFLDFFREKQHQIVPSAPMVVKNDPTLMFTNAGMNQFKDLFLGNKPIEHSRVADTQKCLRVSGKHNDLEEVGRDTYHHTMFEMLGNWSFGDYFKKEAIEWAWELLTEKFGIDKEKLYVTYFEGDSTENLDADEEAKALWAGLIPEERIVPGNKKDNFWEMGDTGPCGPCSEIHIDLRDEKEIEKVPGKQLVNQDHPQVVEVWNLVFIQHNRKADKSLENLPNKHVDTGMGFERLCMALQGKQSNYDTDVFMPLISQISLISGKEYGKDEKTDVATRVISDHIRAVAFAIADGQLPSNTGAGYVIRRILRRAVRYAYSFLDVKEPFLYKLITTLVTEMGEFFPELKQQKDYIELAIQEEEKSFLRTLSNGLTRLDEIIKSTSGQTIPGAQVFELYDTYGFPVDLTRLIANEEGLQVDEDGFKENLEQQKERSKAAGKITAGDWVELSDQTDVVFSGYDELETESKIIKYRKVNQKGKDIFQIVLDKTPFYAESGGQVGDKGELQSINEKVYIKDTIRENDLIIHIAETLPAQPEAVFTAKVNARARNLTANNHSATHLLHAALRGVLGKHVEQRGSLVAPGYLRFDFSHPAKVTDEELGKIEQIVNEKVRENIALDEKRDVPFDEATSLGAMALFGEKYGDKVRVITFDPEYSVELCGGTHVQATGQIGYFKITSEGSVAAGIRRIEAVTAEKAETYINDALNLLNELKGVLKNTKDPIKGAESILKENEELRKTVEQFKHSQTKQAKEELRNKITEVNGVLFLSEKVELDADAIKNIAFEFKKEMPNLFMVLGAQQGPKALLSVMLGDTLVEKGMNAKTIINDLAKEIQGGGGGQPFYATAGGKNPSGLKQALEKAKGLIEA